MDESSRPNKRQKASFTGNVLTQPVSEAPLLEKSSHFWIDDGNVVLRTATKQYRIHRGVLSMHSSVFKDMFSFPQPAEQQTMEGAPIIEITDSADDWDLLLPVIYGVTSMYEPEALVIPVPLLISMLRLGRKYNLERFKQSALEQLETFFPDSLDGWDHLFSNSDQCLQGTMQDSVFQLVSIALELNIQRVLPFGFFTCIRERSMDAILNGTDIPNGPAILSHNAQKKLVLGKEALIQAAAMNTMSWFFSGPEPSKCTSPLSCHDKVHGLLKEMASAPEPGRALDPTFYANVLGGLCHMCTTAARLAHQNGRQETFRLLPSYFGLEPWEHLTNDL